MTAKQARTSEEMRFAAGLEPCPKCGTRDLGSLDLRGDGTSWAFEGACPACGTTRRFQYATTGNPTVARAGRFDLGQGVSTLIAPEQFLAVLDEAAPKVPADPSNLSSPERRKAMAELTRALTSVTELLKQVPPGGERLASASDVRLQRPWLEREYLRLQKIVSKYRPPASIEQSAIDTHLAWLKGGGKGPGQLVIEGKRLEGEWYGPLDLTFAVIRDSDLTNVEMGYAILDEAELTRVVLSGAVLDGASITSATITAGDWTKVRLATARLNASKIKGTDFSKADLERTSWYDAEVTQAKLDGARFANSVFDRAVFQGCSFISATFSRSMPEPQPTSRGAQFIDCDFSGASFADRDLSATTFVRCKLAGVRGPTAAPAALVVTDCDIDLQTLLAHR